MLERVRTLNNGTFRRNASYVLYWAQMNRRVEANHGLQYAVQLAKPESYIRLFVDEGSLMQTLLSRLREQERRRGPTSYLDTLLAAFPAREQAEQPPVSPRKPGLLDPLSPRELEVLQLIGQWKGTRQIAEELHLSIKTIEYYREQIKEKLSLKNASELTQYATSWVERGTPP